MGYPLTPFLGGTNLVYGFRVLAVLVLSNLVKFRLNFRSEGKLDAHSIVRIHRSNKFGDAVDLAIGNLVNELVKSGTGHDPLSIQCGDHGGEGSSRIKRLGRRS